MRLAFLHGFTGTSGSWAAVIRALRRSELPGGDGALGHHLVALPGHDRLARLEDGDDFESVVARLVSSVPPGMTLVGYSLGARLAMSMVATAPSRYAGLVAIGGRPGLTDPGERKARRVSDAAIAARLRRDGLERFVDWWAARPIFATQAGLPAEALERQRAHRLGHDPEQLARSLEVLGLGCMPPTEDALVSAEIPVRLITGALDARFTELAATLAARSPRIEHTRVPRVGHNVVLEAPDAVAARLAGGISPA